MDHPEFWTSYLVKAHTPTAELEIASLRFCERPLDLKLYFQDSHATPPPPACASLSAILSFFCAHAPRCVRLYVSLFYFLREDVIQPALRSAELPLLKSLTFLDQPSRYFGRGIRAYVLPPLPFPPTIFDTVVSFRLFNAAFDWADLGRFWRLTTLVVNCGYSVDSPTPVQVVFILESNPHLIYLSLRLDAHPGRLRQDLVPLPFVALQELDLQLFGSRHLLEVFSQSSYPCLKKLSFDITDGQDEKALMSRFDSNLIATTPISEAPNEAPTDEITKGLDMDLD
ncbi:hypothetical protein C8R46DRAFT_1216633 [Mycena filopes]|nr:hypothetical protein C8R46DRAFT_1216633 [Mycena filopes]